MRKGCVLLISILVFGLFCSGIVLAEENGSILEGATESATGVDTTNENAVEPSIDDENTASEQAEGDNLDELQEEYKDEELANAGLTPDSAFYFIDDILDNFGDDIENREEKVAEIKAMIQEGNYEAAQKALKRYSKKADKFEKEVDPEKREEARRSAAVIKNALDEIKDEIPEEERQRFYEDIVEKEGAIVTAVEISAKIKELCIQLAELDPVQYAKTCRSGEDDGPKWKQKLDKDLTNEQRKEAEEFGEIMSDCFRTSGQDCRCEDISFYDFSVACEKAAPLATACDVEGDEDACDELDRLEMPELPDYLQGILEDIERKFSEGKYDLYMPPECVEEGATTPKECAKLMIKVHAPLECKSALSDSGCETESECRKVCDKIMFEQHAPPECVDKGITDPDECADLMESFGPEHFEGGPGFGQDCMSIEDPTKRLECYDNKANQVGDYYGPREGQFGGEVTWQCKENRIHDLNDCKVFMEEEWPLQEKMRMQEREKMEAEEDGWRLREKGCIEKCEREGRPWGFVGGSCVCGKPGQYFDNKQGFYDESECKDGCQDECPGASRTDCVDGGQRCKCYYEEREEYHEPEHYEESYNEDYSSGDEGTVVGDTGESETVVDTTEEASGESEQVVENTEEPSGGGEENTVVESTEASSGDSGGGEELTSSTGAAVSENVFLNYYYR